MTILSVVVGRHVAAGGGNVTQSRGRPGGHAGAKAGAHAGWDLTRPYGRRIACHALTSRQHELRMGRISKSFRNFRHSRAQRRSPATGDEPDRPRVTETGTTARSG